MRVEMTREGDGAGLLEKEVTSMWEEVTSLVEKRPAPQSHEPRHHSLDAREMPSLINGSTSPAAFTMPMS